MRIASFGDLHLGPTERRERFEQCEDDLEALSIHLEKTHEIIILIGDIYQADYGWRWGPDPHIVEQVKDRYARVSKRWSKSPYLILRGNHDDLIERSQACFSADGISILYHHGQNFDPYCKGWSQRLTMWSVARMRQMGLRRFCDAFEKHVLERGHRWLTGDEHLGQVSHAEKLIRANQATIAVMGHSHVPVCMQIAQGAYANSGICSANSLTYISVDTQHRSVELLAFTPAKGPSCKARVVLPESPILIDPLR